MGNKGLPSAQGPKPIASDNTFELVTIFLSAISMRIAAIATDLESARTAIFKKITDLDLDISVTPLHVIN